MRTRPLVSIIVLSYNRPAQLERALESLLRQTYQNVELIVVDNRSAASSEVATVVARFARVRLLAHQANLGFTGGMNSGVALARGEYVYLTEDDIQIEPDCIAALVSHLETRPDIGLAGPVMLNRGSGTVRCAGGRFALGSVYRMTILAADETFDRQSPSNPYEVTYLPGAMLMLRRALYEELRGFREEFFMYKEDVELCARILQRGLSIVVVPAARVHHDEPVPGMVPGLEFHKIKNLGALYLIHAPLRVLPGFCVRYGLLGALRACSSSQLLVSHLRAWAWVFIRAPRLLAERARRPLSATINQPMRVSCD